MASPKGIGLRSGSQSDMLLSEIKSLKTAIESSKQEVIQTLKKDIDCLKDTIQSLTTRVADLEQQNEELKAKCEQLSILPALQMDAFVEECEQRRRRACNVFVIGLSETTTDSDEAADHDREMVEKMLEAIESTDAAIKDLRRVGRVTPGRSGKRPLLITFSNPNQKWKVLKKASRLRRDPDFSSVYINADLTPFQQDQRKELLSELRDRRRSGEDVVLFRNRVIRRNEVKLLTSKNAPPFANAFDR